MDFPRFVRRSALIATAALQSLPVASLHGQVAEQELRATLCQGCTVTQRVVATLGRPNDSVAVTMWSRVARLGSARYLVGPVSLPGRLAIYRADGTLERVVRLPLAFFADGRPFESPHQVGVMFESTSSTALVLDTGNGDLTRIDTLGRMSRYASMRGSVFAGLSLPDGRVLLSADSPRSDRVGRPLHLIDTSRIIRSIGPAGGSLGPLKTIDVRVLATARRGGVWEAPHDRYAVSRMDSLGRVSMILTRPFSSPPPGPDGTVAFGIASIHEDADGRLWVVSLNRGGAPNIKPETEITAATVRSLAACLTTTIDVIDPQQAAIIHSISFPGPATLFLADGLITRRRDDNGRPTIEIVAVSLNRPQ